MEIFNSHLKIIKAFPFYPFGLFIKQGSRSDAYAYLRNQDNPACRQCQREWEEGICVPLQEVCGHVKCRQCFIKQSVSLDRSCPQCLKCCPECKLVWNQDDHSPIQEMCGHFRCRSCVMKIDGGLASCPQCSGEIPNNETEAISFEVVVRPGKRRGRPPKTVFLEAPPSSVSPSPGQSKLLSAVIKPQQIVAPCKPEEMDVPEGEQASGIPNGLVSNEQPISNSATPGDTNGAKDRISVASNSVDNTFGENESQIRTESIACETAAPKILPRETFSTTETASSSLHLHQENRDGSDTSPTLNTTSLKEAETVTLCGNLKSIAGVTSEEVINSLIENTNHVADPHEANKSGVESDGREMDSDGREMESDGCEVESDGDDTTQPAENHLEVDIKPEKVQTKVESVVVKSKKTVTPALPGYIKIMENDDAGNMYQCQKCITVYESKLKSENPLEMFVCNFCGEISTDERKRLTEMSMQPKYKCTVCGDRFHQLVKFNQHLKSHSGGRLPLTCFKCCQGFIERSKLEDHACSLKDKPVIKCSVCSNLYCEGQGRYSRQKTLEGPSCDCTLWATNLNLQIKSSNKCQSKSASAAVKDENTFPTLLETINLSSGSTKLANNKKLKGPKTRRGSRGTRMPQKKQTQETERIDEPELYEVESYDESTELVDSDSDEEYIPNNKRRRRSVSRQTELKNINGIEVPVSNHHKRNGREESVDTKTKLSVPEFIKVIENDSSNEVYQCTNCHAEYDSEFKRKIPPQPSLCTICGEPTEETKQQQEAKKKPKYECTVCKIRFHQIAELTSHLREKHTFGRMPFICSKCGQGYMSRTDLDAHVCTLKDDKALKCLSCCNKCFGRGGDHSSAKSMQPTPDFLPVPNDSQQCPCTDWAKTQQLTDGNSSLPTDSTKRMSHINGTDFSRGQTLRRISDFKKLFSNQLKMPKDEADKVHRKSTKKTKVDTKLKKKLGRPPGKKETQLTVKRKKEPKNKGRQKFITIKEGDSISYECTKCNQQFSSIQYAYHKHKNKCPGKNQEEENPIECDVCGETFLNQDEFDAHCEAHLIRKAQEKCEICGTTFSTFGLLQEHIETHKPGFGGGEATELVSNEKQLTPMSTWINQLKETLSKESEHHGTTNGNKSRSTTQSRTCSNSSSEKGNNIMLDAPNSTEDPTFVIENGCDVDEDTEFLQHTLNFNLYNCPRCVDSFDEQMSLFCHYLEKHALMSPFDCFLCDEKFEVLQNLRDHFHGQHSEPLQVSFPENDVTQEFAFKGGY